MYIHTGAALMLECLYNFLGKVRLSSLPAGYKIFEHRRRTKSDLYVYGECFIC